MPIHLKKIRFIIALLVTTLLLFLHACDNTSQHQSAAPLGEIIALQALEKSYNAALNALPTTPIKLKPSFRRKFVEKVFQDAGYNYSATITALANTPITAINQHHKDLKELLFLPHYSLDFDQVKDIYSEEERAAILKINNII
ncbi:MAG: hypothetical protein GXP08_13145 [Gammaproteobacteria bacterium]|nr:hypothetical protein [Gammaproteobacteria bacterium]